MGREKYDYPDVQFDLASPLKGVRTEPLNPVRYLETISANKSTYNRIYHYADI